VCTNDKGGFVPPDASKLVARCPACKAFNPAKNTKCKKCGAEMKQQT